VISLFREKPLRMVWTIERDGKTSAIVGASHFFRYSYRKTFTELMRNASAVLFEGPLDRESMETIARHGMEGHDTPSVLKALDPEAARKINRLLAKALEHPAATSTGLAMVRSSNSNFLDVYADEVRPWMALFATWSAYLRTKGWKNSMDMEAYAVAARLGKNVCFMETIEEQLAALDGIPFDRIVAFLNAFDRWDAYSERFLKLYLEGRYDEMVSTTMMFPTRCESILDDRDPVFFARMKPFVEQGNAVAFVGTTHVRGLAPMFEDAGYLVSQVKS
jgi:TraB/PrgY/gumN family